MQMCQQLFTLQSLPSPDSTPPNKTMRLLLSLHPKRFLPVLCSKRSGTSQGFFQNKKQKQKKGGKSNFHGFSFVHISRPGWPFVGLPLVEGPFPSDPHLAQNDTGFWVKVPLDMLPACLHPDMGVKKYCWIPKNKRSTAHFGYKKLIMQEIDFLSTYGEEGMLVIYAGAAPGHHIPIISQMFPHLRFILLGKGKKLGEFFFKKKKNVFLKILLLLEIFLPIVFRFAKIRLEIHIANKIWGS